MATGTMPPQVQRQLATRSHGPRLAWVIGVLLLAAIALCIYLFSSVASKAKKEVASLATVRPWMAKDQGYTAPEKPPLTAPAPARDLTAEELAKLRNDLLAMQHRMTALEHRKGTTAPATPSPAVTKPAVKRPTFVFYENKDLKDSADHPPSVPEYILAPWATHLPCIIEPHMNSDVPGHFTAKITQNVYDTETGRHLLVPQGATVGGHDQGQSLLYGNERLPTVAMGLTIGKRTYDLGQVPVTDQQGTNGLTGKVNNHFWRLVGAVLIGGALRGGQQALQVGLAEAGGVGQVAAGISSMGNTAVQQRVGRALDTRPTIEVFAGQQCQVLLTKPLSLPAVWQ